LFLFHLINKKQAGSMITLQYEKNKKKVKWRDMLILCYITRLNLLLLRI